MYKGSSSRLGGLGDEAGDIQEALGRGIVAQASAQYAPGTPGTSVAPAGGLLSVVNFANNLVNSGFNMYNRVESLKAAKQQATYAQQSSQGMLQYQLARLRSQSGGFGNWIFPLILGVGAIGTIWYIRSR